MAAEFVDDCVRGNGMDGMAGRSGVVVECCVFLFGEVGGDDLLLGMVSIIL